MTATLKIGPSPVGPDFRRFEIDCRHHRTIGDVIVPEASPMTDSQLAKVVVASFRNASGCGCARELWRRYGRVELPPALIVMPSEVARN